MLKMLPPPKDSSLKTNNAPAAGCHTSVETFSPEYPAPEGKKKFQDLEAFQDLTFLPVSKVTSTSSNTSLKVPFSTSLPSTSLPLTSLPSTSSNASFGKFNKKKIKTALSMISFQLHSKTKQRLAVKIIDDFKVATNEIRYLIRLEQARIKNVATLLHCQETIQDHVDLSHRDLSIAAWSLYSGSEDSDTTLSSSPCTVSGEYIPKKWLLAFPVYSELVRKRLDLFQIAKYFKQIATILDDVHQNGICHLDITPKNFMMDNEKIIVLIDFGLARESGDVCPIGCGTPGYIAPELYLEDKATPASDIYSAGIILGEMLEPYVPGISLHYLGSPLVRHTTTTFVCTKIKEMSCISPEDSEWNLIIYQAADLLLKMLQADPSYRITASEMKRHPFLNSDESMFQGYDFESHSRKLLLRPISSVTKRSKEPLVLFRG